jgi:squalene-associated FAD-dependent desaturase
MNIAIIGAGWAGIAAAVQAIAAGHQVRLFEASHSVGGRARVVAGTLPDGTPITLDNGQHILIGAYLETLRLLKQVGVDTDAALLRLPLTLRFPDGAGLCFPRWPSPLDALGGILGAHGWTAADKWSLLRQALRWRLSGFACVANLTVRDLCQDLSPRVLAELITPLCVSALNTPAHEASAQVFLRVMQDALFGAAGGSNLLLPRIDLSELFPAAGLRYLLARGAQVQLGTRIDALRAQGAQWQVAGQCFDAVILASGARDAVRLLDASADSAEAEHRRQMQRWCSVAQGLHFEAIATVYAWSADASLAAPMLSLRSDTMSPAQFVFDRGQLGGPAGLLAFVVSASNTDRATLQTHVLAQAQAQLGLCLQPVQTIVEKRATFACAPALLRPAQHIAPGLLACGDYVAGPYPATLEGAVRSGVAAVAALQKAWIAASLRSSQ